VIFFPARPCPTLSYWSKGTNAKDRVNLVSMCFKYSSNWFKRVRLVSAYLNAGLLAGSRPGHWQRNFCADTRIEDITAVFLKVQVVSAAKYCRRLEGTHSLSQCRITNFPSAVCTSHRFTFFCPILPQERAGTFLESFLAVTFSLLPVMNVPVTIRRTVFSFQTSKSSSTSSEWCRLQNSLTTGLHAAVI
jgi:hypothetical protein